MKKIKVFASYSRKDLHFVEKFIKELKNHDDIELYIDTHDIEFGEKWRKRLTQLIVQSDLVICFTSPNSMQSTVCNWEVDEAQKYSKRLLPIVWTETPEMNPILKSIHYFRVNDPEDIENCVKDVIPLIRRDIELLRIHTWYTIQARAWEINDEGKGWLLSDGAIAEFERITRLSRKETMPVSDKLQHFVDESRKSSDLNKKQSQVLWSKLRTAQSNEKSWGHKHPIKMGLIAAAISTGIVFIASFFQDEPTMEKMGIEEQYWIDPSQ